MFNGYLWVVDPRQVTFLCLAKEKSPKEKRPRSLRPREIHARVPCAPRQRRARAELAGGVKATPLGLEHRLATTPGIGSGARLALRGLNSNSNYNSNRKPVNAGSIVVAVVVRVPVGRGFEHRRVWAKARRGADRESAPETQYREVLWLGAGPNPRSAASRLRPPGGLSLCVLSLGQARESTPTAVREPQFNLLKLDGKRPRGRSINYLDSRFRGNDNSLVRPVTRELIFLSEPRFKRAPS
jgi:hypothetical protein